MRPAAPPSATELQCLVLTLIFKVQNKCEPDTVSKFVSDVLEKLRLQLTELQHNSLFAWHFNQEALIILYVYLPYLGSLSSVS